MAGHSKTTVERALELAREGRCRSLDDIRRQLAKEGCSNIEGHLAGMAFKRQLRTILSGPAST